MQDRFEVDLLPVRAPVDHTFVYYEPPESFFELEVP